MARRRGSKLTIFILLVIISFITYQFDLIPKITSREKIDITPELNPYCNTTTGSIKIANWNLQIFGEKKSSNQELMNTYSDLIKNYDIIFVQEIRDSSGQAFPKLCTMLPEYNCKISSPAGRSTSKEQYGIIYKKSIELTEFQDFNPDSQDRWERPPIKTVFLADGKLLTIYNIHAKPEDVKNELDYLQQIIPQTIEPVIILGDLNADCSYYSAEKETEFDSWKWVIKDTDDTTVSASDCAYDRIILDEDAQKFYKSNGIYKDIIEKQSDHYLVCVELK